MRAGSAVARDRSARLRAPMRVAYVVSRFPDPSETFVLREMIAVERQGEGDVELFALFPPKHEFVHPEAERWVERTHRVTARGAVAGLLWWLVRRPVRTTSSLWATVAGYWRSPGRLARSLVTSAIAAAHARTMRRDGVDHIHAHFATYPALAAWFAGRLLDVPYSFTAHAHDIFIDQLNLARLVHDAQAVSVISQFNRELLTRFGADRATPAHVVHCGVDPAAYSFRPRAPSTNGPVRAICVATLNELKGHAILLDALAREGLERVQLDLVGSGPLEQPLRAQAARLGITERVRFWGTRSEREVAELLDEAEVFVLASVVASNGQMDGIPVALMEALAAGLPVIASRLSGIPELVRDGETGLLVEPGDPEALADAFRRLLADPDAAIARARNGRSLIEAEFDIAGSGAAMLELFAGDGGRRE
ncbi:MAG TPA: glycosyltransferase [Solirubrobacteraceae bacterium]|nr:glycosyltransferase [Solirubrobacteraceae bacterium]